MPTQSKPSPRAFGIWWDAQPYGIYTCTECGKQDSKSYVQPQHPYYAQGRTDVALCGDCIAKSNQAHREQRKAQLQAMARCEVPGCQQRGTWRSMGVLLCGRHLKRVKAEHNRSLASIGGMGLFLTVSYDRASILDMAQR